MRVIKDRERHAAIEVDPETRLLLRLGGENSVILQEHPATWFEIVEGAGRVEYRYVDYWQPLTLANGEPYPPVEALRKMMRGSISAPTTYGSGVLDVVMECLPHGDFQVFVPDAGFLGRYCCVEDAKLISQMHGYPKPMIFSDFKEFCGLSAAQQNLIALAVGAKPLTSTKPTIRSLQEIFAMSKEAKRKKMQQPSAATKKAAGTGKQKPGPSRADGPVAKARAIFAKHKGLDTAAIKTECVAAGINPGTTSVQLGKWRKENGVVVERGPKAAKAKKAAKAEPKPKLDPVANAKPKKAAKKVKAKTKDAGPAQGSGDHGDEYIAGLNKPKGALEIAVEKKRAAKAKKLKAAAPASTALPAVADAPTADPAPSSATAADQSDDIPF